MIQSWPSLVISLFSLLSTQLTHGLGIRASQHPNQFYLFITSWAYQSAGAKTNLMNTWAQPRKKYHFLTINTRQSAAFQNKHLTGCVDWWARGEIRAQPSPAIPPQPAHCTRRCIFKQNDLLARATSALKTTYCPDCPAGSSDWPSVWWQEMRLKSCTKTQPSSDLVFPSIRAQPPKHAKQNENWREKTTAVSASQTEVPSGNTDIWTRLSAR